MTHDTGMLQPPSLPVTQPAFPACLSHVRGVQPLRRRRSRGVSAMLSFCLAVHVLVGFCLS